MPLPCFTYGYPCAGGVSCLSKGGTATATNSVSESYSDPIDGRGDSQSSKID
jgi:hypothetical protein